MTYTKEVKFKQVKMNFKEFIFTKIDNLIFLYLVNVILYIIGFLSNLITTLTIPFIVWITFQLLYFFFTPNARDKWVVEL